MAVLAWPGGLIDGQPIGNRRRVGQRHDEAFYEFGLIAFSRGKIVLVVLRTLTGNQRLDGWADRSLRRRRNYGRALLRWWRRPRNLPERMRRHQRCPHRDLDRECPGQRAVGSNAHEGLRHVGRGGRRHGRQHFAVRSDWTAPGRRVPGSQDPFDRHAIGA